jgi:hypothetical protein
MNEKRNLPDLVRLHRGLQWLLVAVVLLIGGLIGYLGGNWHVLVLQDRVSQLEQQIVELYERSEQYDYQQHIAQVELGIERAAATSLQQELLAAQDENFALRRELTFYQKIMSPENEASGVVIDSLELQASRQSNAYHFRLALVQTERQRNLISGTVTMRLRGRQDGTPRELDLQGLAAIEGKDRQFSMRYFTVQAGTFILPEGFVAERIDVEVTIQGGAKQPLARSFFWEQLLTAPVGEAENNT